MHQPDVTILSPAGVFAGIGRSPVPAPDVDAIAARHMPNSTNAALLAEGGQRGVHACVSAPGAAYRVDDATGQQPRGARAEAGVGAQVPASERIAWALGDAPVGGYEDSELFDLLNGGGASVGALLNCCFCCLARPVNDGEELMGLMVSTRTASLCIPLHSSPLLQYMPSVCCSPLHPSHVHPSRPHITCPPLHCSHR